MTDKPKWVDLFGIDPDYTADAVEEPKYTESDMRVLTEAALRLGRKEAGEEIAAAIDAERENPVRGWNRPGFGAMNSLMTRDAMEMSARIARDITSHLLQDSTSGRTDPAVDSDLPPEPQAVRSPQEPCEDPGCPVPLMHSHPLGDA